MQKRYDQNCPVARTLDIIGDRWTMLIVRDLALGCTRFNEILAHSPGLPPKVLSQRLKFLIDQDLVERTLEDGFPPRPRYQLSERGRTLLPVVQAIGRWGLGNLYEGEEDVRKKVVAAINEALPGFVE